MSCTRFEFRRCVVSRMKWIDIVVYYFITGRTISRWRKILSFSFSFSFYLRETKGLWRIFHFR